MKKLISKRIITAFLVTFISITFTILTLQDANAKDASDIFINLKGEKVTIADFKGKAVLMNFIQVHCARKGCNNLSLQLLRTQLLLKNRMGKDLVLISVTIEPDSDTPEVMKEYAKKYSYDPNGWSFLSGSKEATGKIMKQYGVEWVTLKDGSPSHKTVTVLLNREGKLVKEYINPKINAQIIVDDIKTIID